MPYFVKRSCNGRISWEIDYRDHPPRLSERLGEEKARIQITHEAAKLGIDGLLRLARETGTYDVY